MKILLLCSSFNGLAQRAWIELRRAGHEVSVEFASSEATIVSAVRRFEPELIICPFLRERVPADVCGRYPTIIVHPGPIGDPGASSLDWAIMDGERRWGVTAVQAVGEMDAGPIWATRSIALPATPPRKSALYNGPVADAAIELIGEVVAKATDASFRPEPLDARRGGVTGPLRPTMRDSDRQFAWSDSTESIQRRIAAADGSPGVATTLGGVSVSVFDAHRGPALLGEPGSIVGRRHGAILVRTGDGTVWIGQARTDGAVKLPATMALRRQLPNLPEVLPSVAESADQAGRREISHARHGDVGVLRLDFYNGAMSTGQCRRLLAALRYAKQQRTSVLVIRGGDVFSNGIHLNAIHAAPVPAMEAWRNINAMNDVCREIISCTSQLVVTSIGTNASAGGVILGLGADRVVMGDNVVLNPHYQVMGLYGSEYWTYVLPRRVGDVEAGGLTQRCLPIGADVAHQIGLVDEVLPGSAGEFDDAVVDYATRLAGSGDYSRQLDDKCASRQADERRKPLEAYGVEELAEMSRDIFDDRNDFSTARNAFVTKQQPSSAPARIASHRTAVPTDRLGEYAAQRAS